MHDGAYTGGEIILDFEIWDKRIPMKRFTRMQICSLTCTTGSCLDVYIISKRMEDPELISIG